jgi:membrane protein YqaA with SNARE-associated domain
VIDFVLHFDKHLLEFIRDYGSWVYAILFTIVFAETGFVVTPFLPGDSLLFAAGALCATGDLSMSAMLALLMFAAFAGNTVNYGVGRFIGPRVFTGTFRLLNKEYLDRAHAFFEQYGGKAIVLARFVPIVRTFAPFLAGVANGPGSTLTQLARQHESAVAFSSMQEGDEARTALSEAIAKAPDAFERYTRQRPPWYRPEDYEHMLDGLRKTGWQG